MSTPQWQINAHLGCWTRWGAYNAQAIILLLNNQEELQRRGVCMNLRIRLHASRHLRQAATKEGRKTAE